MAELTKFGLREWPTIVMARSPYTFSVTRVWQLFMMHVSKVTKKIVQTSSQEITQPGGDETRLGYVQYVPVISANVPCTYYVHS